MTDPMKQEKGTSNLVGIASIALCVVGGAGAVAALSAADKGDFVGVGACLIASALSFGLMLNAFLRG